MTKIYTTVDFEQCLKTLSPQIANYWWMLSVISLRQFMTGRYPTHLSAWLKRLCNPHKPYYVDHTSAGVAFLADHRDRYIDFLMTENFDRYMTEFMKKEMSRSAGAYIDVGANFGVFAATLAKHIDKNVQVLAFEPSPGAAQRASATFALNKLTNVQLFQLAVGESDGEISFFEARSNSALASSSPVHEWWNGWTESTVECRSLDSLMNEGLIPKVGLIKIDVEGHELQVIRGAQKLIERDRPVIIFEYNYNIAPKLGWSALDIRKIIEKNGSYEFQILNEDGTLSAFPPPEQQPGGHPYINIVCKALESPVAARNTQSV